MSARELFHWSLYLNLCSEGSILMLKKQDLGINSHVAKNGSRDQSLTGIGGPRVTLGNRLELYSIGTSLNTFVLVGVRNDFRLFTFVNCKDIRLLALVPNLFMDCALLSLNMIEFFLSLSTL